MVKPHELQPAPGSNKKSKRVGRGPGSGKGKTAGRGTKGTRARGEVHLFFEGGQMPLARRLPKLKGFTPPNRVVYGAVNVGDLDTVGLSEIGPDELRALGLVHKRDKYIKILGTGEVTKKLSLKAHAVSEAARTKIESGGGTIELIDIPTRKKAKKRKAR